MSKSLRGASNETDRFGQVSGRAYVAANGHLKTFATVSGGAVIAAGALAAGMVTAGLKTAAGMEQAQIAFSTLLGSGQKATAFIDQLKTFAAATPFEIPGLIDASRQLLGAGAAAKDVIPTLTAYGDAAGALGISQDGFNHIMLATSQAMAAGTLHAGDLLQMTEAGLPVWKLLSEALGKPVAEVRKLSEQGKLLSKDVLPKLQAQMEKDYGGAMAKQSQTLAGLWSTMTDTFKQGMADALIPMEPMLRGLIPQASVVMGAALKALGTGAASFFNGLSGHVKRMNQEDRPKLELFGLGIRALGEAFKGGGVTSTGFIGVMERIGTAIRDAWTFINRIGPQIFGGLKQAITDLATVAVPLLVSAWETFRQPLMNTAQFIIRNIIPAITAFTGFLAHHKTVVQSVALAFGVLFVATKAYAGWQLILVARTKLMAEAQILLNAVMDANPILLVITLLAALAAGFIYAYKHSETFRKIVDGVWKWFVGAIHWVMDHWKLLLILLTGGLGVLIVLFITNFTRIKNFISGVFTFLVNFVRDHWKLIVAFITGPLGALVIFIITHWNTIKNTIVNAMQAVLNFLQKIPSRIAGFFSAALSLLVNAGRNIVTGLWNGLKAVWNTVTGWFKSLGGAVKGYIGDAAQWLFQAGKDVIQGFWNGLKYIWDKVTGFIGGIVGWIKDHKGPISLDRKLLYPAGKALMEGLVTGMMHGFTNVIKFVGGIGAYVAGLAGGFVPGNQGIGSGAGAGGASGSLASWITSALLLTGTPLSWGAAVQRRIMFESGGNPNAINLTDINAQQGHPSQGLMQTIPSTFFGYHQPGTSMNITDPIANIAAALNYIKAVYGTIFAIDPPVQGYATGAWNIPYNQLAYLHGGEMVIPSRSADKFRSGMGGVTVAPGAITVYAAPGMDEERVARQVAVQLGAWVDSERRRAAKGGRA